MTEGGFWHTYGDYALLACAAAACVFVLLYMFLAPWWHTAAGRNIMAVMGSLATATAYFAWVVNTGGVPSGFWPARAILFTFIFVSIAWRVLLFLRHQVQARLKEKDRL